VDPTHLLTIGNGKSAVDAWIKANPHHKLNLSSASLAGRDFSGWNLGNVDFSQADLSRADFRGAILSNSQFDGATLIDADLQDAICISTLFRGANLTRTKLRGADLYNAQFARANVETKELRLAKIFSCSLEQLLLEEADFSGCDLHQTKFHNSKLICARFIGANLREAGFQHANLSGAILDEAILDSAILDNVNLQSASLVRASLRHATLSSADLRDANITGAEFYEAYVDSANFDKTRGVTRAKNLHTVRFQNPVADVRYFDSADIPTLTRTINWERIRFLGRVPLFAASYFTLITIPFLFYFLDIFNRRIDAVLAWASQEVKSEGIYSAVARIMLDHLHRERVPELSSVLLISTILLGIGATIFLACPTRIREFSRDQWRDQLGHSLIHYLPLSWWYRWLCILCLCFYLIGGVGIAWVLASKLWNVFWFIIAN
jgi:uncharacterized protein YjbI with pentapeptide repeats